MLRVTVQNDEQTRTYRLEGSLTGSWVRELEHCWRSTSSQEGGKPERFDLTQVTYMDEAGKAFLQQRHGDGADLIAAGCWMRALVAEITGGRPDCGCS